MPRSIPVCSPYGFTALTKQIMRAARPLLEPWTRVVFRRLAPWDDETLGLCGKNSARSYEVHLSRNMTYDHMTFMMLHEIAHVIHWSTGDKGADHGPAYWRAHGELYCRYLETT